MAMARWDTTTMTVATDVYDDDDNTASCEVVAHREAEAGPSICNNQTMRGENGRKLVTTTLGTVTMLPSTMTTMATADYAGFDDDNDNVDDGDGATGVGDDGDGGDATGHSG